MKNLKFFSLLPALLLLLGLASCDKDQAFDTLQTPEDAARQAISPDTEADKAAYIQLMDAHQARMDAMGLEFRNCKNVARVPQDHPTIQAAIDAVCDGGKVFVGAGTYNEVVTVHKPGLDIKANGVVNLNGSFFLTPNANDVSIQQFNITPPATGTNIERSGIFAAGVSGGNVKLNTITGAYIAVNYRNVSGVSITHNTVSGSDWGIIVAANGTVYPGNVLSSNNLIAHNTVTGTTAASPIHLQGNADNNTVRNNTVTLKTNFNPNIALNAGIMLLATSPSETCDNNTIRNNVVTDNASSGIWVTPEGSNNIIGPDNIFSSNLAYGIWLGLGTAGNHAFDNTALDNGECDIVNQGTGNTFVNNTAGCTFGL
jgi:parallel beta-helix repeat protein